MPSEQIQTKLAELHNALERLDSVDPELLDLLKTIDGDIHALLESGRPDEEEAGQLMQRVEELGADFAARHPQIEQFFQELVAVLGRLGI